MRILIAEDETIIRLDLRALLERRGFDVVAEARDGEEAVALAASEAPDLALLDVKVDAVDRLEAPERLLQTFDGQDRAHVAPSRFAGGGFFSAS